MDQLLIIDSADRNIGSNSSTDFSITLPTLIYGPIKSIEILDICVPHTWYNINSTNNKLRFIGNDATERTVTIPVGNYSLSVLLTSIGTELTNADTGVNTYTATVSTLTEKITITASTNTFSLLFANVLSTLHSVIGYTSTSLSGNTSYTATGIYNLNTINRLCIKTSIPTKGQYILNNVYEPLLLVSWCVSSDFGFNDSYFPHYKLSQLINPITTSLLTIQLTDQNNNIIDLNGQNISLNIKLTS
jgi:hypothetical protein